MVSELSGMLSHNVIIRLVFWNTRMPLKITTYLETKTFPCLLNCFPTIVPFNITTRVAVLIKTLVPMNSVCLTQWWGSYSPLSVDGLPIPIISGHCLWWLELKENRSHMFPIPDLLASFEILNTFSLRRKSLNFSFGKIFERQISPFHKIVGDEFMQNLKQSSFASPHKPRCFPYRRTFKFTSYLTSCEIWWKPYLTLIEWVTEVSR